jgi:hypothetical protein
LLPNALYVLHVLPSRPLLALLALCTFGQPGAVVHVLFQLPAQLFRGLDPAANQTPVCAGARVVEPEGTLGPLHARRFYARRFYMRARPVANLKQERWTVRSGSDRCRLQRSGSDHERERGCAVEPSGHDSGVQHASPLPVILNSDEAQKIRSNRITVTPYYPVCADFPFIPAKRSLLSGA